MIEKEIVKRIHLQTNGRCYYCGRKLKGFGQELDHIIPRCRGGSDDELNLRPCCRSCNSSKGTISVEEFREQRRLSVLRRIEAVDEWLEPLATTEPFEIGEIRNALERAYTIASDLRVIFYGEWLADKTGKGNV